MPAVPALSNPFLHFSVDRNTARWNVRSQTAETPFLENVRLGARLRNAQGRPVRWEGALLDLNASMLEPVESAHGRLQQLRLVGRMAGGNTLGLRVAVEFALPEAHPFLLWRVKLRNDSLQDFRLDAIEMASMGPHFTRSRSNRWERLPVRVGEGPESDPGALRLHPSPGHLAFFSNGYQSWSFSGALQSGQPQPASVFGPLGDPKHLNLLNPALSRPGHFASDMFAALGDRTHNAGLVAGWLAQREQFGHIEALLNGYAPSLSLSAHCDGVLWPPGGERVTDWAYLQFIALETPDPLGDYVKAVARENAARVPASTPIGWCSWYHYFDRVTERDMTANVAALQQARARLPLDFVQLDDGYQAQVGDWFETNARFPRGLRWLSDEIRAHGHTPGLWLAPYIVRSDAQLNRLHPDWFLRAGLGRKANAGYNWFRWCYALDPTHPGVRDHTRRLIETAVKEWGFPYLKLDFLYAAALPGRRYDATQTRAQAMRLALTDIRDAAGEAVFLLGCGCPLGSAVGLVDGMRIGTDVAPNWHPELFTPNLKRFLHNELDFVSTRNAVRNIISRAPLHRRWWLNDPDCLLARDHDTALTEAEVRSLATVIALSGGMFLVSDDMTRLNADREHYIAALMPLLNETRVRVHDWLGNTMPDTLTLPIQGAVGEWLVAGLFNWADSPRDRTTSLSALGLPNGAYYVANFWENTLTTLQSGQPLELRDIPAHGVHLLALRPVTRGPALISSSFHFSQGREVTEWVATLTELRLTIELNRTAEGELILAVPAAPTRVTVDGRPIEAVETAEGLWSLGFAVERAATVILKW